MAVGFLLRGSVLPNPVLVACCLLLVACCLLLVACCLLLVACCLLLVACCLHEIYGEEGVVMYATYVLHTHTYAPQGNWGQTDLDCNSFSLSTNDASKSETSSLSLLHSSLLSLNCSCMTVNRTINPSARERSVVAECLFLYPKSKR